jgi:alkaline phosphatase
VPAPKVARNVVLMIGDGMGSEHVWAAWLYNGSKLNITTLPVTGFSITTSASHGITDSAAGGTAIACGCKAINGQLGLDANGRAVESLAARMRKAGKSTGIVVTKSVTDATGIAYTSLNTSSYTPHSHGSVSVIANATNGSEFTYVTGGSKTSVVVDLKGDSQSFTTTSSSATTDTKYVRLTGDITFPGLTVSTKTLSTTTVTPAVAGTEKPLASISFTTGDFVTNVSDKTSVNVGGDGKN